MSLTPSLPVDGNGRTPFASGVTPGVGYSVPQMGPQTTDPLTGQAVAPAIIGASAVPPSIVQKANAISTGSVASIAAAFTNANLPGNSIVVVVGAGDNGALTVTDSLGNTYNKAILQANGTTFQVAIYYAVNILGGANTVTVADASSDSMALQIYEVSGLLMQATSQPSSSSSGTGTGTTASTSALATSVPNSLAFLGVAVGTTAEAITAVTGTPWHVDASINPAATVAGLFSLGSLSLALPGMTPVVPQATIAASKAWAAVAAVFRPVSISVEGTVQIGGYNYTHITTAATALNVKTGPGTLHAVIVNTRVASGTIELDDAISHTNAMGIITFPGTLLSDGPIQVVYDIAFSTGLNITTTGTMDITVVWK